jgi:hypothetical protein
VANFFEDFFQKRICSKNSNSPSQIAELKRNFEVAVQRFRMKQQAMEQELEAQRQVRQNVQCAEAQLEAQGQVGQKRFS